MPRKPEEQPSEQRTPSLWNGPLAKLPRPWSNLLPTFWEDMGGELSELTGFQGNTGLSLSEDEKNVYVEAALPGLKSDDIEVTLDHGVLWIKGQKQEEEKDKEKRFYRRATSSYSYRFALPEKIDERKDPQANYQDGILKITFAKTQQNQAKKINITKSK